MTENRNGHSDQSPLKETKILNERNYKLSKVKVKRIFLKQNKKATCQVPENKPL